MYAWLIVLHLIAPSSSPATDDATVSAEPLRYRGIERLLAKFEAAAEVEPQNR